MCHKFYPNQCTQPLNVQLYFFIPQEPKDKIKKKMLRHAEAIGKKIFKLKKLVKTGNKASF